MPIYERSASAQRWGSMLAGFFLGCGGPQSALEPAGDAAERIAELFWQMTAGAALIWLVVVGLALHAAYRRPSPKAARGGRALILGGGVVLPVLVLAGLLAYGLALLPPLLAAAPAGSSRIAVTGEQYFFRVRYLRQDGPPIELANEVRLARRRPVEFQLTSKDVIHSFWVPSLAGKVDMIPGRTTRLSVVPTRSGEFRGVCAEYCGTSHALMGLRVSVVEPPVLEAWLAAQARPARPPPDARSARGAELFGLNGCGACHTIRGTAARGVIGPDLTHVGGRATLAGGIMQNDAARFERWLREPARWKPGVAMPHFAMLPDDQLRALAAYLESLQ